MNLTIIIPTLGRMNLLLRLIHYYHTVAFKGMIVIGDGSSLSDYEKVNKALTRYIDYLQITHLHLPGSPVSDAVCVSNAYIKTDYVCLVGDDDFIVPITAAKCISFLEANKDYVASHGLGVILQSEHGDTQKIDNLIHYRQTVREENSALVRLRAHLEDYTVSLFSVHRTVIWKRMWSSYPRSNTDSLLKDKTFFDELIPCCMSVGMGKVGNVDGLYLVRQDHNKRYLLPSRYLWLLTKEWYSSFSIFRAQLARVICNIDSISYLYSLSMIDNLFSLYLDRCLFKSPTHPRVLIVKDRLRRFKFVFTIFRRLRWCLSSLFATRNSVSLIGFKNSSSPYYSDFKYVLSAVMNPLIDSA